MEEQKIFDKFVKILKPYAKDQALLEKATMEMSILDDLKLTPGRTPPRQGFRA
jgi:hypothetical protein